MKKDIFLLTAILFVAAFSFGATIATAAAIAAEPAPPAWQEQLAQADAALAAGEGETALELYRELAEADVPAAMYQLGRLSYTGEVGNKDFLTAGEWLVKAADAGEVEAMKLLADIYDEGKALPKSVSEAARLRFYTGRAYEFGVGVEQDMDQAVQWYSRASASGHLGALLSLAYARATGEGIERNWLIATELFRQARNLATEAISTEGLERADYALALLQEMGPDPDQDQLNLLRWYRLAHIRDLPEAKRNFGLALMDGVGIEPDPEQGELWLLQAAEGGDAKSWSILAEKYQNEDPELAAEWYAGAAELGDIDAQFHLAELLRTGQGVAQNIDAADRWLALAAEGGHPRAQYLLGFDYMWGANGKRKDVETALVWLNLSARQDVADAQFQLGYAREFGIGIEQDYAEAANWYGKAAAQDLPGAQANLGFLQALGYGVEPDAEAALLNYRKALAGAQAIDLQALIDEAMFAIAVIEANRDGDNDLQPIAWWRYAHERGHPESEYQLSRLYRTGTYVSADPAASLRWLELAAEHNYPEAQYDLARQYADGGMVEKNMELAVQWYNRAAQNGHADAQINLGVLLLEGSNGVGADPQQAAALFMLAAEQGVAVAQYNLGICYMDGKGVRTNPEQAVHWFRLAAEQGEPSAEAALANAYQNGIGVEPDPAEALIWYRRAADRGDATGQTMLGLAYTMGDLVERDPAEAARWFELAAAQGDIQAKFWLAKALDQGLGIQRDSARAAALYRESADAGNVQAYAPLAYLLAVGDGVNRDIAEALRLYSMTPSALNEVGFAQTVLAEALRSNRPELAESIRWYR
ncbi:MAG: SEL1-like repeat protein, partial [Planctomycetes bacterium]|nr:SEL1-like repeat protein [Planctomycetota bacterium]